jgi:hypothetical protein
MSYSIAGQRCDQRVGSPLATLNTLPAACGVTADHAVLLRAAGIVPVNVNAQADHPQGQGSGEVAPRAPWCTVVDSQAAGQSPLSEGLAHRFANLTRGDLRPGSEGGKPWCGAPRRCTHQ